MYRRGVRSTPTSIGRQRTLRCALEALESRRLLSTSLIATPAVANATTISQPLGYSPAQVLHAYGFDAAAANIGAVGGDGSGQTIAIVEAYHSPTLESDLRTFDKQFNLAGPPSLVQMNQTGGSTPVAGDIVWSQETALDVEWAHVVAPNANIVVVEAKSADIRDLLTAVDTARHLASVSVVSMSWGISEFPTETSFDNIFTTPRGHQSVTFVASSGDTAVSTQVQWPAVSPNVVSVGGTTLTVNTTNGGKATETSYSGAVSGISLYEPKPVYQNALSTATGRSTPDVVYDANPSPGFAVYDSDSAGWQTLGGTSSGAPQWAALLAIANQVRAEAGKATLNGATQTLPALYNYYGKNQQATITTSSGTAALIAGALLSNSGKPQATGVITALVNNTTTAHAPAAPNANADQPIGKLLSKLPRRSAHPFILNVAPPMPLLRFAAPFATSHSDLRQVLNATGSLATAAPMGNASLSSNVGSSFSSTATGLLAMALPEIMTATAASTPHVDPITELMAAIYGEIPALGTNTVVPVGSAAMLEVGQRTSWFVAHVNVAATFSDAIAAFVDDCAVLTPASTAINSPGSQGHARAWMVTIGVVILDGLIIYYLAPRPRRAFNSNGSIHWFIANA